MRTQHALLSALFTSVFLLSSCNSAEPVGKGNAGVNIQTKKSEDAQGEYVAAKSSHARGKAIDGKDAATDSDNKGDDGKDAGKDEDGYGKDEAKGDDAVDTGIDGKDPMIATDNDDDNGKGGKGGKGPGQHPGQTPNPGKPPVDVPPVPAVPEVPEIPEVVVELPAGKCQYLDPAQPAFTIAASQFGPNLPPIPVPSTSILGDLQNDGDTYISAFTLYQKNAGSTEFYLTWDGRAGRIPHDYSLVVVGASNDKCTAFLKLVKQEPRTLNGCFDLATKIRMANGKDQIIAAISKGDMVYNPITKKGVRVAEVVKGEEKLPMYDIGFGGKHMIVTEKHPVPVMGGMKMAKDVVDTDYIFDEKGIIQRVTTAKALPVKKGQIVVNVRLDSSPANADHMIIANGVLSGDLFLQRKLAGTQTAATK